MRKTIGLLTAAVLVLLALVWVPAGAQEDMIVPMGEIILKPLGPEPRRSPVAFPHALHFDFSCRDCHHTWKGQEPILGCTAAGCHDVVEVPRDAEGRPVKDPSEQIRYYRNAYHQMCIGCHLQIAKDNEVLQATRLPGGERRLAPTGPTGCIQCHPQ
jgi:hypothetical protein